MTRRELAQRERIQNDVTFDLYVWKSPRDLDVDRAEALLESWQESGGDPNESPFEPDADVGWFYRELLKDVPGLVATSDAVANPSATPIWLATTPESPARVVGISLSPTLPRDALDAIFGLAAKYDLIVFDLQNRRLHLPLEEMAAYASATFWPAGAIQAAVAGGIGGVMAVVAWFLGIPLLSGLLVIIGGFMFVMAVYTFVHEGRKARNAPRSGGGSPPPAGGA
jgi:hypothetical protein